ncbi:hypothetical protein ACP4OV_023828 [Aristida adscensionis]
MAYELHLQALLYPLTQLTMLPPSCRPSSAPRPSQVSTSRRRLPLHAAVYPRPHKIIISQSLKLRRIATRPSEGGSVSSLRGRGCIASISTLGPALELSRSSRPVVLRRRKFLRQHAFWHAEWDYTDSKEGEFVLMESEDEEHKLPGLRDDNIPFTESDLLEENKHLVERAIQEYRKLCLLSLGRARKGVYRKSRLPIPVAASPVALAPVIGESSQAPTQRPTSTFIALLHTMVNEVVHHALINQSGVLVNTLPE